MSANYDPNTHGFPVWVIASANPPTQTRQYPTLTMEQILIKGEGGVRVWMEDDQIFLGAPSIEATVNAQRKRVGLPPIEHPTDNDNPGVVVHILEMDDAGNTYLKPVVLRGSNGFAIWKGEIGIQIDATRLGIDEIENVVSTIEEWRKGLPFDGIPSWLLGNPY